MLAPGIEGRALSIPAGPQDVGPIRAAAVRIDPTSSLVRVHYDPAAPVPVGVWQARTGAPVVINASFFQEDNTVAGLLAAGGEVYGTSFDQIDAPGYESGGMFGMAGGALSIRSTERAPYQPGESLQEAVQGLPLLIEEGLPLGFDLPERPARRTVVALDSSGRLVLISVAYGAMTLPSLRDWLASSPDLSLRSALNLDGGPSTGIAIGIGERPMLADSLSPVPSVIAVYPAP